MPKTIFCDTIVHFFDHRRQKESGLGYSELMNAEGMLLVYLL